MRQNIRVGDIAATLFFTLATSTASGVALAGKSLPTITIFVNDQTELQVPSRSGLDITLHNLDQIHRVESRISASLPANQEEAQEIAMGLIKPHESALKSAWEGIIRARAWRIEWLPAIVFGDGETLWYGRDIDAALSAWQAYQVNGLNDEHGPQ